MYIFILKGEGRGRRRGLGLLFFLIVSTYISTTCFLYIKNNSRTIVFYTSYVVVELFPDFTTTLLERDATTTLSRYSSDFLYTSESILTNNSAVRLAPNGTNLGLVKPKCTTEPNHTRNWYQKSQLGHICDQIGYIRHRMSKKAKQICCLSQEMPLPSALLISSCFYHESCCCISCTRVTDLDSYYARLATKWYKSGTFHFSFLGKPKGIENVY